jgi:hypothetical protein
MSDVFANLELLQWPEPQAWHKKLDETVIPPSLLQIPDRQPIVETVPEAMNWHQLDHHRERAIFWATAHKLRFIPLWLMASNAIIWNLSGTRIPHIGGPMTGWHWGLVVGCGQHPALLLAALWRTEMYDKWKLALATGATLWVTHQAGHRAQDHAEQSLRYWRAICEDLKSYLDHTANDWNHAWLRCEEEKLLKLAGKIKSPCQIQRLFHINNPRPKWSESTDLKETATNILATAKLLQHKRVKDLRKTFAKNIPKSLTESHAELNGSQQNCETIKLFEKRADLMRKFNQHKRKLKEIVGDCNKLTEEMMERCKEELVDFKASQSDKAELDFVAEAITAYNRACHYFSQAPDLSEADQKRLNELEQKLRQYNTAYDWAIAMEWPGQVELDYELLYLLAKANTAKWHSDKNINALKTGTFPPAKFYDWAVNEAIKQSGLKQQKMTIVAARRTFIRGWLAKPIRDALASFGN